MTNLDSLSWDEIRAEIERTRQTVIDSALALTRVVYERSDDPEAHQLAGLILAELKMEKRLRALLASEALL